MHENEVWELIKEKEVGNNEYINCAWIYTVKESEGKPLMKAHLVARGNMLNEEEDENVFSPVVKASTLRSVISISNKKNMKISLFDVSTAFLNAKLRDRIIYMKQPSGFIEKNKVMLFEKSNIWIS